MVRERRLQCGRFTFDGSRPLVMGIVNVTPDSFFDGGTHASIEAALLHAQRLVAEGADLIDLGAESTRPGAVGVPPDEEWRRLGPVLEALRDSPTSLAVPLSIDTRHPATMRRALAAGADLINDVGGFASVDARDAVAASTCGVCTMHMRGTPATMQDAPAYGDVVDEVRGVLAASVDALIAAGVDARRIVVDPGFGFGKSPVHNLALLQRLDEIVALGYPVLAGLSRKGMIGEITGRPVGERLAGSVAAALAAVDRGAAIVRVHDVAATVDALAVRAAVLGVDRPVRVAGGG